MQSVKYNALILEQTKTTKTYGTQVHPQGASLDYVVSYVRALFPATTQAAIHHVLQKHDEVFQRTTSGVGANIETRWTFAAFQNFSK